MSRTKEERKEDEEDKNKMCGGGSRKVDKKWGRGKWLAGSEFQKREH
jgi:hypothetical protein